MKLSQFKFKLPEEKIALHPTKYRDESRLMVLHRKTGEIEHKEFKDVLNYFDDKDVFIFNDTKVFPARLYGNKEKTGARIEVFLLRELNEELRLWDVLVDPARKIRIGNKLYFGWFHWAFKVAFDNIAYPYEILVGGQFLNLFRRNLNWFHGRGIFLLRGTACSVNIGIDIRRSVGSG